MYFNSTQRLTGRSCIFIVQHPEQRQGNNSGTSKGVLWSCTRDRGSKSQLQFFRSSPVPFSPFYSNACFKQLGNICVIKSGSVSVGEGRGLQERGYSLPDQSMKFLRKGGKEKAFRCSCKKLRLSKTGIIGTGSQRLDTLVQQRIQYA